MTASNRHPLRLLLRGVRTWSLMALLPLAAAGCSADAPAKTSLVTHLPNVSWTACSRNDACEARWLTCRGWRAVNRDHGNQVEAWYARANRDYLSRADCDGRPKATPAAFCRLKQCTLE